MTEYIVYFKQTAECSTVVEADSEEEALAKFLADDYGYSLQVEDWVGDYFEEYAEEEL